MAKYIVTLVKKEVYEIIDDQLTPAQAVEKACEIADGDPFAFQDDIQDFEVEKVSTNEDGDIVYDNVTEKAVKEYIL